MLAAARAKAADRALSTVQFVAGDALALPFEDEAFDAATVGFGLRNVADLPRALAEIGARPAAGREDGLPRAHPIAGSAIRLGVSPLPLRASSRCSAASSAGTARRTPTSRSRSSASQMPLDWPR